MQNRSRCTGDQLHDVMFSVAIGLPWSRLQVMVRSFRHFAGFCYALVLLVDTDPSRELDEALEAYQVTKVRVRQAWPFLEDLAGLSHERLLRLLPPKVESVRAGWAYPGGLETLRFFACRAWLESQLAQGARVAAARGLLLLADSTDVAFQGDPFKAGAALRRSDEAWVFEEHPTRQLGSCSFSRMGLAPFGAAFGAWSATVVNDGVIIGSQGAVLRLISAMLEVAKAFPQGHLNDQAIVNYLTREPTARDLWPKGLRVVRTNQSLVRNLGPQLFFDWPTFDPDGVLFGADGERQLAVLRGNARVAPVVHQYNRDQFTDELFRARWQDARWSLAGQRGLAGAMAKLGQEGRCQRAPGCSLRHLMRTADAVYSSGCTQGERCCRRLWRERAALKTYNGPFLTMQNYGIFLLGLRACLNEPRTLPLSIAVDFAAWGKRVTDRTISIDVWALGAVFQSREGGIVDESGTLLEFPRRLPGKPFPGPAFLVCLDRTCALDRVPWQELVAVAWSALAQARFQDELLKQVFERLKETPPRPGHVWLRHISWAPGRLRSAKGGGDQNASVSLGSLRFRPLAAKCAGGPKKRVRDRAAGSGKDLRCWERFQ